MYLIICYAIHNREVASVDKRDSYEEALDFLMKDAKNTYEEEVANSGNNPDEIELEIIDDTATVTDIPAECTWTWEIKEIQQDMGFSIEKPYFHSV